jgi:hypothetical protein
VRWATGGGRTTKGGDGGTVNEPSNTYLSGDGVTSVDGCGGQGGAEDLRGALPVGAGAAEGCLLHKF